MKRNRWWVLALVPSVVLLTVVGGFSASGVGPRDVSALSAQPRSIGLHQVMEVSKDGRYALGITPGHKYVVRDVVKGKTRRTLPSGGSLYTGDYAYVGLSDTGRYVSYGHRTASKKSLGCRPWVRDVVKNKARLVATDSRGRALKILWGGTSEPCPGFLSRGLAPSFPYSLPALSGNGRWVAFCASLEAIDRADLYVKDLKRGTLIRREGVCPTWDDPRQSRKLLAPQISDDGRVVLIPGSLAYSTDLSDTSWGSASVLVDRADLRTGTGGANPFMTEDGSTVFSMLPLSCQDPAPTVDGDCNNEPGGLIYNVGSGSTVSMPFVPIAPPWPDGPGQMSRRGRYVIDDSKVHDRSTNLYLTLPQGPDWHLISGNGKIAFGCRFEEESPCPWYSYKIPTTGWVPESS